jgi:hypothetical protein
MRMSPKLKPFAVVAIVVLLPVIIPVGMIVCFLVMACHIVSWALDDLFPGDANKP